MADDTQAVEEEATDTNPNEVTQDVTEGQPDPAPADNVQELPDWAKSLIGDLRTENAKHRTARKSADKAAEKAAEQAAEQQGQFKELYEKTKAELETAEAARQAAELATLKAKIGAELKLPAALVDRLRGETEDELKADAVVLLDAMPSPQVSGTDANSGVNGNAPTPQKSDDEIREMAARIGVSFEHLKKQFIKE